MYGKEHWEQLIDTIIERVGVAGFLEAAAYVLEQKGYVQTSSQIEAIAVTEMQWEKMSA